MNLFYVAVLRTLQYKTCYFTLFLFTTKIHIFIHSFDAFSDNLQGKQSWNQKKKHYTRRCVKTFDSWWILLLNLIIHYYHFAVTLQLYQLRFSHQWFYDTAELDRVLFLPVEAPTWRRDGFYSWSYTRTVSEVLFGYTHFLLLAIVRQKELLCCDTLVQFTMPR